MAMPKLVLEASAGSELVELMSQYIAQEMMGDLGAILVAGLMLLGALLMLLAAVGLIRLPDLPTRMHASTKAGSLGAALIMLAVAVAMPTADVWARVMAVIAFLLLTAPVAAHVIGRAGYFVGVGLWEGTIKDDLDNQYDYETHTLHSGQYKDREIGGVDMGVHGVVDPEDSDQSRDGLTEPAEREVASTLAARSSDPKDLDTELGLEAEGPGVDDSSEFDVDDSGEFGPGDPVEVESVAEEEEDSTPDDVQDDGEGQDDSQEQEDSEEQGDAEDKKKVVKNESAPA